MNVYTYTYVDDINDQKMCYINFYVYIEYSYSFFLSRFSNV